MVENIKLGEIPMDKTSLMVEYYAPDGTIRGVWRRTTYSAKWSMEGNAMCFQYPGRGDSCLLFSVTGDRVLFYRQDGSGGNKELKLLPGNPKNL